METCAKTAADLVAVLAVCVRPERPASKSPDGHCKRLSMTLHVSADRRPSAQENGDGSFENKKGLVIHWRIQRDASGPKSGIERPKFVLVLPFKTQLTLNTQL